MFTATIAPGTLVDLYITGFTNPATEQILSLSFETIWGTNKLVIDKFENLIDLSSGSSPSTSEAFASTRIVIVDWTNRGLPLCQIKEPLKSLSPINVNTAGAQAIETTNDKFEAIGAACAGRATFKLSAYAKLADGSKLNPRYAIASLDGSSLIQVTLDPTVDTRA